MVIKHLKNHLVHINNKPFSRFCKFQKYLENEGGYLGLRGKKNAKINVFTFLLQNDPKIYYSSLKKKKN